MAKSMAGEVLIEIMAAGSRHTESPSSKSLMGCR